MSPRLLRHIFNLWPPFAVSGIHVTHLGRDWRSAEVELRAAAADGGKVLRWFDCPVRDAAGEVVARVRKQLYVRLQPRWTAPGRRAKLVPSPAPAAHGHPSLQPLPR